MGWGCGGGADRAPLGTARGLSWAGADFSTDVVPLGPAFATTYDAAVAFMVGLRKALDQVGNMHGGPRPEPPNRYPIDP